MPRIFSQLAAFALALLITLPALAEDRATPEQAVAMVHRVITDMKSGGKDAVIAEINTLSSKYRDRDLYVTVMDMNGKELAHGSNKKMQGVDLIELKDTDGKTIAYSTNGSSTHGIVTAFMKQYDLKARPTAPARNSSTRARSASSQPATMRPKLKPKP